MSNDQKQQTQPKPQRPAESSGREPIPVSVIRTHRPANFPDGEAGQSLKAREVGAKKWTIDYMPWMRAFRVVYTREGEAPVTRMFPEGGIESWDPVES